MQTIAELLPLLANPNAPEVRTLLARADTLRDDFNVRIEQARTDMMTQVRADAAITMRDQQGTIIISAIVTALAAIVGLIFAIMVSTGITRPVHRLLEGHPCGREAGHLDGTIDVTTRTRSGNSPPRSTAWSRNFARTRGCARRSGATSTRASWRA